MGGFRIIEDRPTPKAVYNFRIYLFSAVASAGAMAFGYDGAFFGTTYARTSFQTAYGISTMTADQKTSTSANLTSSYLAAAFFGALFAWPVMERLGRVWGLRVSSIIFLIGAAIMTASSSNLNEQYAGRVLTGFGAGGATAIIPTFISEAAPPPIRGALTGWFEISYQAGSLVGFWINYGINQHIDPKSILSFRIPMAIQLIPIGLLAVGSLFIKESPAWLIRQGRDEQAYKNLEFLRKIPRDHIYIQQEVGFVKAKLEEELEMSGGRTGIKGYLYGAFKELSTASMRHRLVITFFMFFWQNLSGAAVINYYSPTLFTSIGITDSALYTGIYGLVKAIGSFLFFLFIVDRSGRRIPWLVSAAVCSACLLYIAVYLKIAGVQGAGSVVSASTKAGGNAATAMVMIYSLFWSFGGNGLPWIVSSEIFPGRVRSITGAFAAAAQWLVSFAATEAFPYMYKSVMQVWGCFLFYCCCCLATFTFTFFFIPETKGIPIECMDTLFSGPVRYAAWRQRAVYPPDGLPPLPDRVAAQVGAYMHDAHKTHDDKYERDEREQGLGQGQAYQA